MEAFMQFHPVVASDPASVAGTAQLFDSFQINNEAQAEQRAGNYEKAERLHLQALNIKRATQGEDSITYALSLQAISESQICLGKWDKAEENLLKAQKIREIAEAKKITTFDAAVTRDTLAQVYEAKGNLEKARAVRTKFPNNVSCSFYSCPKSYGQKLENLKQCGKCKSTFYCGAACQKGDWKRHKKYCKEANANVA